MIYLKQKIIQRQVLDLRSQGYQTRGEGELVVRLGGTPEPEPNHSLAPTEQPTINRISSSARDTFFFGSLWCVVIMERCSDDARTKCRTLLLCVRCSYARRTRSIVKRSTFLLRWWLLRGYG